MIPANDNSAITYGSVCSGIEAASVAWGPLGWRPAWFSEIESFPSAVLAHHWPQVPNHGDMTRMPMEVANDNIPAPDVLVGGTPCQSFSVAGARRGLEDERGQLTIKFVELANAIDDRRRARNEQPCIVVWENVPGVLSSKDNAFGAFLGLLAGEDTALESPGRKWSNAGYVHGPERTIAWRVLDAQHFGVAQRRRRVFVVASARAGFDPAAVLFEREGVRRDTPPSREAGKGAAADVAGSLTSSGRGVDRVGDPRGQDPVVAVPPEGCFWNGEQITQTLDAVLHKGQTMPEKNRFPAVIQPVGYANRGYFGSFSEVDIGDPLRVKGGDVGNGGETIAVCAVTGDIAHALNTANNGKGCSEDRTGRGVPTIAFSAKDYGADAISDLSPTLRAGGHSSSHANAGVMPAVCFVQNSRSEVRLVGGDGQSTGAIAAEPGVQQQHYAHSGLRVRRLTPMECERLQGFSDGHTLIPTNKRNWHREREEMRAYFHRTLQDITDDQMDRLAADGPRYKAIGNSMAVPCMAWIGRRIDTALEASHDRIE